MSDSINSLPRANRWRTPIIILAILGLGVAIAGAALWWANRPIQATILTQPERAKLEQKLAAVEQAQEAPANPQVETDAEYVRGEKEIILTERELNGLIHENTAFGDKLKLELVKDAVHARISADIPEDFPIMAGKKLKGKARFVVKDQAGSPALILEDLTIWGVSLPNAWLGELKGQNLLGNVISPDGPSLAGVEDISVSNRTLVIKLAE